MFWIVDSILMHKRVKLPISVHYHNSSFCTTRYGRLESEDHEDAEGCHSASDDNDGGQAETIELRQAGLSQSGSPRTYTQLNSHKLSDSDR